MDPNHKVTTTHGEFYTKYKCRVHGNKEHESKKAGFVFNGGLKC